MPTIRSWTTSCIPLFDSKQAGLNNYTFYNNPKVDAGLLAARAEPDAAKRYADYNAVGKMIMQDVPEIPIYFYGVARVSVTADHQLRSTTRWARPTSP